MIRQGWRYIEGLIYKDKLSTDSANLLGGGDDSRGLGLKQQRGDYLLCVVVVVAAALVFA